MFQDTCPYIVKIRMYGLGPLPLSPRSPSWSRTPWAESRSWPCPAKSEVAFCCNVRYTRAGSRSGISLLDGFSGTAQASRSSGEWYGREFINSMPLPKSASLNIVGFRYTLGFPLRMPTKQYALSDRMVAGVPNCLIACRSTATAFSEVYLG